MPFDWTNYLKLARFLGEREFEFGREAAARSAVSRAYYAAYHHARDYATRRLGFESRRQAADHGSLVARFRERRMVSIADRLKRLREWREQCDYDDTIPDLANVLSSALRETEDVIERLS
ncbi:MAG: hypothetical protein ACR2PL_12305 [Dehalococcoidia bacterium]